MAGKENGASGTGEVHVMFTAKGGVGKTHVSSLVTQFRQSVGKPIKTLDLDQSNPMLARIPELEAEEIDLLTDGRFDVGKMDALIRRIGNEPGVFLLDFGASTFQFAWNYFAENGIVEALAEWGKRVVFHAVVTGGPEMPFTLASLNELSKMAVGRQIVVWVNPIKGPVSAEGKEFPDMQVYLSNKDKIIAVGMLPPVDDALTAELHRLARLKRSMLNLKSIAELDILSRTRLQRHRDRSFAAVGRVMELVDGEA